MSSNPAPLVDPNRIAESAMISSGIESQRVRPAVSDTMDERTPNAKILGPSADPMDDFYAEFARTGDAPQKIMSGGDYAAYMDYKKRKLQQLQAESLKQQIREMYSTFRNEKNFAEMEYLEREFPFIIEEKKEFVRTQQWVMENIADFYANGGKPTAKQLLFQYALKTDDRLREMAGPIANAFFNANRDNGFGGEGYFNGWLTNKFYPEASPNIRFPGGADNEMPWNRNVQPSDYLSFPFYSTTTPDNARGFLNGANAFNPGMFGAVRRDNRMLNNNNNNG